MRRALLLVTAIGTLVEGVVIAGSLLFLGTVIGASSMSLNGSDPSTARVALWVLAALVGLGFVAITVVLLRARPRRGVLIAAASGQWVLTILAGMCGLYLGVLFAEPERRPGSTMTLSR